MWVCGGVVGGGLGCEGYWCERVMGGFYEGVGEFCEKGEGVEDKVWDGVCGECGWNGIGWDR